MDAVLRDAQFIDSGRILYAPMSGLDPRQDQSRAVYLRASYAEEIAVLFSRFTELSLQSFAIVHTPDVSAVATRDAALARMAERRTPRPATMMLKPDGSNAVALATSIASAAPQAVVILADTIAAAVLARELRRRMPGLFVCVTSSVDANLLQQFLGKEMARGLIVSRVVPNAVRGTDAIVRQFNRAFSQYLAEMPSAASLEGYLAGRALIASVQKLVDPRAINDARSLRSLGDMKLDDWKLDFGNGLRASHYVDTSIVSAKGVLLG